MGRLLLFVAAAAAVVSLPQTAAAQGAAASGTADAETGAVRRAVETFLYSEEEAEVKGVVYHKARVLSPGPREAEVVDTPLSKPAAKHKAKVGGRRRRIVSIDLADAAAVVKVETDFVGDESRLRPHRQYLSLLKVGGAWRIVSVLMPPVRLAGGDETGRD